MKHISNVFAGFFGSNADQGRIQRDWDRERARALTPSERAEIDAIFARYL